MMRQKICQHIESAKDAAVQHNDVCEECVKTGDTWVHLRTCLTCGGTHCCDSSPNKHATAHAQSSGHQVVQSAEEGEDWMYCYADRLFYRPD